MSNTFEDLMWAEYMRSKQMTGTITKLSEPSELASSKQIGGDWYKSMAIEPAYFAEANKLSALEHLAVKYLCRHRKREGAKDLDKAIHALELLKEYLYTGVEYGTPRQTIGDKEKEEGKEDG